VRACLERQERPGPANGARPGEGNRASPGEYIARMLSGATPGKRMAGIAGRGRRCAWARVEGPPWSWTRGLCRGTRGRAVQGGLAVANEDALPGDGWTRPKTARVRMLQRWLEGLPEAARRRVGPEDREVQPRPVAVVGDPERPGCSGPGGSRWLRSPPGEGVLRW